MAEGTTGLLKGCSFLIDDPPLEQTIGWGVAGEPGGMHNLVQQREVGEDLVKGTGYELVIHPGDPVYAAVLTPAEKRQIRRERGAVF